MISLDFVLSFRFWQKTGSLTKWYRSSLNWFFVEHYFSSTKDSMHEFAQKLQCFINTPSFQVLRHRLSSAIPVLSPKCSIIVGTLSHFWDVSAENLVQYNLLLIKKKRWTFLAGVLVADTGWTFPPPFPLHTFPPPPLFLPSPFPLPPPLLSRCEYIEYAELEHMCVCMVTL